MTEAEDTEIDRNMVELLNDPLVHMIRNAVDHGIESPEERVARGKPVVGTVRLSAYHQGGNVVIVTGQARIATDAPPADQVADYVAKYREPMRRIGMTPDRFARTYSVAIRITPERLRGH